MMGAPQPYKDYDFSEETAERSQHSCGYTQVKVKGKGLPFQSVSSLLNRYSQLLYQLLAIHG